MDLANELLNDFGVDDEILEKDSNEINNNKFTSSSSSSIENNNASSTSSSSATTTTTTMTAVNTTPNPIKDANSFLQSPLFPLPSQYPSQEHTPCILFLEGL